MFNAIKTAAIAATLAVGALAAAPAQADSLHVKFKDGDIRFGMDVGYGQGGYGNHGYGRQCRPWKAVEKARWMGFRRAHVVDVDWNRIVVKGKKYGGPVKVVFGKAPHCPIKAMY